MITTTDPKTQQALLQTTTKPLLHLTTAKRYPHAVGALESRGRTVQEIDESDPLFALITDNTGVDHKIYRLKESICR